MNTKDYAIIKDDNVINIIVIDDTNLSAIPDFVNFHNGDYAIETGVNAHVGGTYDGSKFWLPKPYPSWIKNEEFNEWEPPVPYPVFDEEDSKRYTWNEETISWVEVIEE